MLCLLLTELVILLMWVACWFSWVWHGSSKIHKDDDLLCCILCVHASEIYIKLHTYAQAVNVHILMW